jgi:hypothetical protein
MDKNEIFIFVVVVAKNQKMGSRIDNLNNSTISENLESSRRNKENDESIK